jgi:hypothetical protein
MTIEEALYGIYHRAATALEDLRHHQVGLSSAGEHALMRVAAGAERMLAYWSTTEQQMVAELTELTDLLELVLRQIHDPRD